MDSIAKFSAAARHVGGADLTRSSTPLPWSDILQKELRIAGRIDQEKANEYLCSQRSSRGGSAAFTAVFTADIFFWTSRERVERERGGT